MTRGVILLALAGIPVAALVGCSTAPQTHTERMDLKAQADQVVAQAQRTDPTLRDVLASSAGYAVFPEAGKGGFIVGAGYGKGVVYQNGVAVGYCDMTQGSVGATIGGQSFTEIIVFKTPFALDQFKNGDFTLGADATAVALKAGAAANAQTRNNIVVFVTSQSGLMADASIAGQGFRYISATDLGSNVRQAGEKLPPSDNTNYPNNGYNRSNSSQY